jgi:NADH-quinone oxidoreductase subunit N
LLVIMVVNSAIGLFYYLRVVVAMYHLRAAEEDLSPIKPCLSLAGSVALAALALVLVWLGVYPAPLIRIIQTTLAAAA